MITNVNYKNKRQDSGINVSLILSFILDKIIKLLVFNILI